MLSLATLISLLLASSALAHPTPPNYNGTTPEEAEAQLTFSEGSCSVKVGFERDFPK